MSYRLILDKASSQKQNLPLSNCVVFCKGPMHPSPLRLRVLASRLGARCVFALTEHVTHVVIDPLYTTLSDKEACSAQTILPQWIVECAHLNKRVSEESYKADNQTGERRENREQIRTIQPSVTEKSDTNQALSHSSTGELVRKRICFIDAMLKEDLPASTHDVQQKEHYYRYTNKGRHTLSKVLLKWRLTTPKRPTDQKQPRYDVSAIHATEPTFAEQYNLALSNSRSQKLRQTFLWKLEAIDYLLTHPPTGPVPIHVNNEYVFCHVRIDSFFLVSALASLPLDRRSQAVNAPFIIRTRSSRSVSNTYSTILDCNNSAKQLGIEPGMTVQRSLELCPSAVVIDCDFDHFKTNSQHILDILGKFSNSIMPISCNEAVLDISGRVSLAPTNISALEIAVKLKTMLLQEAEFHCTIGIGDSLSVAQLGLALAGTGGIYASQGSLCKETLLDKHISILPDIPKTMVEQIMDAFGISKCGELLSTDPERLVELFGEKRARNLRLALECRVDDPGKGFTPVLSELMPQSGHKLFYKALECKKLYKKSTESRSVQTLKAVTITLNYQHNLYENTEVKERLSNIFSTAATETCLKLLHRQLALTSNSKMQIKCYVKWPASNGEREDMNNTRTHYISTQTDLFNTKTTDTLGTNYVLLKEAAQRCAKYILHKIQHGTLTIESHSISSDNPGKRKNTDKPNVLGSLADLFEHLLDVLLTVSPVAADNYAESTLYDVSEEESSTDPTVTNYIPEDSGDSDNGIFRAECEQRAASKEGILPITSYVKSYSIPSRAYEHTCLFSTSVEVRLQGYLDTLVILSNRIVTEKSEQVQQENLINAAVRSFVAQLCADGDLEGAIYIGKRYRLPEEARNIINKRFATKVF